MDHGVLQSTQTRERVKSEIRKSKTLRIIERNRALVIIIRQIKRRYKLQYIFFGPEIFITANQELVHS